MERFIASYPRRFQHHGDQKDVPNETDRVEIVQKSWMITLIKLMGAA